MVPTWWMTMKSLVGDGDYDGVVICAGKNGDDCDIFRSLVPHMQRNKKGQPFILHLSTVSAGFAQAAYDFLSAGGIDYVNYPLTGGPLGAENANMLILASGDESIYARLEPMLQTIGNPRYFSYQRHCRCRGQADRPAHGVQRPGGHLLGGRA